MTVTTWQAEEAPPQSEIPASSGPSIRADVGTIKSSLIGQEQTTVHRNNPTEITPVPEDIFSTARNNFGSPTGDRSPSTTIELEPGNPGSRVTIQVAESLGFITKNEYGQYIQVTQPQGTPEGSISQHEGPELFEPQQEAAINAQIADIPEPIFNEAMAKAAASVALNGDIEDFSASVSSTTGIPVEQLQASKDALVTAFQGQADAAIHKLGVDPQDLYDWARENHPQELARAVREQIFGRSLTAYRELAKNYLQSVPPSLKAIGAHFPIKPASGKGTRDMVTINGIQMEVTTAARLGLI
jgi:hypothetical protein